MKEIWKDIPNYNGYQISSYGRVKSLPCHGHHKKSVILKTFTINSGYMCVTINHDNKLVHRLVAESFLSKIPGKDFVNHVDGDKLNNNVSNLEWVTRKENMMHSTYILLNGKRAKIKCIELDATFNSVREAGRATRCEASNIVSALKGRLKTAGGYHWEYVD